MNCTKEEYNKYLWLRDYYGEHRGCVDMLDFPAIQEKEAPEYTVFLDMMEDEYTNRQLVVLQEYENCLSPLGEPLREMRTYNVRNSGIMEDFINPLDEPVRNLKLPYQAKHSFVYKDSKDLCFVRQSNNKTDGELYVREFFYDISDMPKKERNFIVSYSGKPYFDKGLYKQLKGILEQYHCEMGSKVFDLYSKRMRNVVQLDNMRDNSFASRFAGKNTFEKLDAVLMETDKFPATVLEECKEKIHDMYKAPVVAYGELEYWQTLEKGDEKTVRYLGTDVKTLRYDGFTKASRAFWCDGLNNVTFGAKAGDFAVRGEFIVGHKQFFDGTEVTTNAVTTYRLLPVGKELEKVEELQMATSYFSPPLGVRDLRSLENIESIEELNKRVSAANPFIENNKQVVTLMRKKVNELFPLPKTRLIEHVFADFIRNRRGRIDKGFASWLGNHSFREDNIKEVSQSRLTNAKTSSIKEKEREENTRDFVRSR